MGILRASAGWQQRYQTLAVCIGAYFGVRISQVIVGPVVPEIIAVFDISRGTVGFALTGMWVVYAIVQIPSGVFADRFGERPVVISALVVTAIATLAMAAAPAFAVFGLAVAVIGFGAGIYYNPATTLLNRSSGPVGRAIGFHRIGGQAAGIAAPVIAAAAVPRYGWRETIVLSAALVVVATVAFVGGTESTTPRRRSASLRELADPGTFSTLLARSHTRVTTFMMTLVEFAGLAAMAFVPTLLIEHHGFGSETANILFAVFFATAAITQPIAGWLSDRQGRDRTIAALSAAGALGYGGLAVDSPFAVAAVATVLAGTSMSATPVIQSRMLDGLGTGEEGAGFGVFRTVYLLIGASGTFVIGTLADITGWSPAVGLLSALFVVVLIASFAVSPPESKAAG